jgi:hypothetical protein
MTHRTIDRRAFLSTSATVGFTVCGLCMCSRVPAFASEEVPDTIDLTQLEFCGYTCPTDCAFLQGTLNDDLELKKKAWKMWKIGERFDLEFDPEQAFCYGCKSLGRPRGIVLTRCTVRDCCIDRGLECCIDCDDLTGCDRDLWRRFPAFKDKVVDMQQRYRLQA